MNKQSLAEFEASKIVEALIVRLDELTELIGNETKHLREHRFDLIVPEQKRKALLSDEVQKIGKLIRNRENLKDEVSSKDKERLRKAQGNLRETLMENHQDLVRARAVNKIITDSIIMAMQDGKRNEAGYDRTGKFLSDRQARWRIGPLNLNDNI